MEIVLAPAVDAFKPLGAARDHQDLIRSDLILVRGTVIKLLHFVHVAFDSPHRSYINPSINDSLCQA